MRWIPAAIPIWDARLAAPHGLAERRCCQPRLPQRCRTFARISSSQGQRWREDWLRLPPASNPNSTIDGEIIDQHGASAMALPYRLSLFCCTRVICGASRQGETVAEVRDAKNNEAPCFVRAGEVRETMNKSSHVCARVRVGEHPVSYEPAVSWRQAVAECSSGPRRAVRERRHCGALTVPVREVDDFEAGSSG